MRTFFVVVICLILVSPVLGKNIKEVNATLNIDGEFVYSHIAVKFSSDIGKVTFPFKYDILGFQFEGAKCYLEKNINNIIVCEPSNPFLVGQVIANFSFYVKGTITQYEKIRQMSFDLPISRAVDSVNVIVRVPESSLLVNTGEMPIYPTDFDMETDGRRIILIWNFIYRKAGDTISLRVNYEEPAVKVNQKFPYWIFAVLFLVLLLGIAMIYVKISKKSSLLLSVLNEPEKIVVNYLSKEGGKNVDQRKIVQESGFSKAKVTRILQSLEARGIVTMERVGRKNKINLKKKFVEERE